MTLTKDNVSQMTLENLQTLRERFKQTPQYVWEEYTRDTGRVWSNVGQSYDRDPGVEDGEPVLETVSTKHLNPDYESQQRDLRLVYRYHSKPECRRLAGVALEYSDLRIRYGRAVASIMTVVGVIAVVVAVVIVWRYMH